MPDQPRLALQASILPRLALFLAPLAAMAEPDPRTAPLAKERPLYLDTGASIDARVADQAAGDEHSFHLEP